MKAARTRKETANESTRAFGPAAVAESKAGLLAPAMEDSDCPKGEVTQAAELVKMRWQLSSTR